MLTCLLLLLAVPQGQNEAMGMAMEMMRGVNAQILDLRRELQKRHEVLDALKGDLTTMREEARRERAATPLATSFLASPPAGSDSLGVARAAVFAPRIEAESPRRRDTVLLKVKRIEPGAVKTVGDLEFLADAVSVDLPLDQNGALYLVEWSTSDGQTYNLVLRDGASGQPAATVPVKPLQSQGRFVFVGYRVE
ncbi:MAG TPA: hypothetical protein VLI67_03850 [Vicinamibacteria bacterium]|nr:hypothetical protein [Vicinamibacteria bacterium]